MGHWRRYVYLLVNNFNRATYPLRRINASSLFSSSNNNNTSMMKPEEARLPNPFISFTPPLSNYGNGILNFFSLFGRGKNKSLIAGADQQGFTFLYDLDQHAIHKQVLLNEPKIYNTISVAAGDALYVLDKRPRPGSFEALRYEVPMDLSPSRDWRWYCLQPPPYVLAPGYTPSTAISAYAVVNDTEIWTSTPGFGTYSFHTVRGSWRKSVNWELPFRGRADYFPEYGLWLGFSSRDGMLCSSVLRAATKQSGPQLLHKDWKDVQAQEGWILMESFLVHLGYGKFCVAKFFQTVDRGSSEELCQIESFVVLTGLTLQQCGANGELRMIRHRSQLYYFQAMTHCWAF
ncbi:uncharacterized protein LOC8059477 [Sorghum bicolor]|uniref:F-box associated domain-containing protein n=1 Tax=Sorghum bicolor TaxID=4558 RepID=C5X105_SORBI|nr:uncharacterized protein LOC8059477 [Sorghum bicolor]EER92979.1 hypothetical protein SORBI_3001G531600 [Sorghum bicolor]OQU93378.1 hypothetical protein SORBI_3001G531600 [Sorghum bicolor]OQU93379.1 hypothetical protein SORBI_3001G531600 [Sorghum bicolor]|eukprot:XP_002465981.1 uncharacterized protein LOC8059477 [Sorghum bicolor]